LPRIDLGQIGRPAQQLSLCRPCERRDP